MPYIAQTRLLGNASFVSRTQFVYLSVMFEDLQWFSPLQTLLNFNEPCIQSRKLFACKAQFVNTFNQSDKNCIRCTQLKRHDFSLKTDVDKTKNKNLGI